MKILYLQSIKVINCLIYFTYPNGSANRNVLIGTMFKKAQANVADVYWSPRRKKYCVNVTLKKHQKLSEVLNNSIMVIIQMDN